MKKLILASSSPRRKRLLEKAGLKFTVIPNRYEEKLDQNIEPHRLAKSLALGKAKEVAARHKDAIVLAADTIIVFEGEILGKPKDAEDAKRTLSRMSGKSHLAITGFTIIDTNTNKIVSKSTETKVYFRELSSGEIESYVEFGEPLDRAGSYAIESNGSKFVEKIEGSFEGVEGLPLEEVMDELKQFGVEVS